MKCDRNETIYFIWTQKKRRIFLDDAKQCLEVATNMLYYELSMDPQDDYIDFPEIRKRVMTYIKENIPEISKLLGIPNDYKENDFWFQLFHTHIHPFPDKNTRVQEDRNIKGFWGKCLMKNFEIKIKDFPFCTF